MRNMIGVPFTSDQSESEAGRARIYPECQHSSSLLCVNVLKQRIAHFHVRMDPTNII
jgi:hypothetical protein